MIRSAIVIVLLSVLAAACSVVERRSPAERYCRAALAELTKNEARAKVDDADTNARSLNGRRVMALTLTYDQGPTKRLMTCFFHAGAARPLRINYRGGPLTPQRMKQLHRQISK
jgi:hypothetical protein